MRLGFVAGPVFAHAPTPFVALLARQLGLPVGEVVRHFRSARRGDVTAHLRRQRAEFRASGQIGFAPGATLYALVRTLRPAFVVETGVSSGVSSAFILAAIRDNGAGTLVSIDLPFTERDGEPASILPGTSIDKAQWSPIPPGESSGWLVPDALRDRWRLRLGDAAELLPQTLEEVGEIGLFLHDSLHTLDHMLFEFETAWPHIAPGGILASDDLDQGDGRPLRVFSERVHRRFFAVAGVAFMRKPG